MSDNDLPVFQETVAFLAAKMQASPWHPQYLTEPDLGLPPPSLPEQMTALKRRSNLFIQTTQMPVLA